MNKLPISGRVIKGWWSEASVMFVLENFSLHAVFRCQEVYENLVCRSTMLLRTRTLFWPSTSRDEISVRIEMSIVVYREEKSIFVEKRIGLRRYTEYFRMRRNILYWSIIIDRFYCVIELESYFTSSPRFYKMYRKLLPINIISGIIYNNRQILIGIVFCSCYNSLQR